jgi:hypothetical protein
VNSSAALVGDSLYVGSGNSNDGNGGGVHALRLVFSPSGAFLDAEDR